MEGSEGGKGKKEGGHVIQEGNVEGRNKGTKDGREEGRNEETKDGRTEGREGRWGTEGTNERTKMKEGRKGGRNVRCRETSCKWTAASDWSRP